MADILKYDMTNIWASAGDVVAPDAAKINAGWGVEVVPRQWWNWFENRQDNNIAYMLQKGFPEWDATTQYIINKSYVQRNGIVYKATATSTNSDPVALTSWVRAFGDYSVANAALGALTPAADCAPYFTDGTTAALMTVTAFARTLLDDTTNTAARTTLGAQTLNANLTALSGATAAANNLPYFTSTTAMGVTTLTAFARTLLDDANAATMRATLGLGTAALGTVTTSTIDSTIGNILRVGDWGGFGSQTGVSIPNQNCDDITISGIYNISGATTNVPAGYGSGAIILHMAWANTGVYYQISLGYGGTQMAFRRRSSSGWGAWNTVTNSADLQAALAGVGLNTTAAPATLDLDTAVTSGFYRFTNTALNRPLTGSSGMLQVMTYGTTYVAQTVITVQTSDSTLYNRMFTRTMNSGVWGPWKEQAVTDGATLNNVTLTGTPTVAAATNLKIGTNYTDLTNAALYVNNGFNTGAQGITVDNFAPSISFVDRTTSSTAARWRLGGNVLRFDASGDNGATWTSPNLLGIGSTGNLGVSGVLSKANVGVDVGVQTAGNTNITGVTQIGVRSHFNGGADATSAVMGFVSENSVGDNATTATTVSLIDFQANTQTINANHTVTTASCFRANDKTSTRITTAYGFHSLMATRAGVNRWNIFAAGTAPNYIASQLTIGGSATPLPAASVALQANGDVNVNGTLNAVNVSVTGTLSIPGAFSVSSVNAAGNVVAGGDIFGNSLNATGNIYSGSGSIMAAGGYFYAKAATSSANSHVWFQDSSGNTTGLVYATPSGTLTLQAGTAVCANFSPTGASNFNAINGNSLALSSGGITSSIGPVISIRSGQSVTASLYSNASFEARAGDGGNAAYGFHRAGINAAALYIQADSQLGLVDSGGGNWQVLTNRNLSDYIAINSSINAIGSYGLFILGDGRWALGPGDTIAGASIRYSSTAATTNGATGVGTWRIHGYVTNSDGSSSDSVTLCIRIA